MDFYRINEEYNQYLQKYEKENRGVTKVPNIRYTDRNKFAFGAVMQVHGMNYYVSVSSSYNQVFFIENSRSLNLFISANKP